MNNIFRHLVTAGLLAATVNAAEYPRGVPPPDSHLLYASFDQGSRTDSGIGFPEWHGASSYYAAEFRIKKDPSFTNETEGVRGRALDITRNAKQDVRACLKAAGHICLRCGTISLWYRMPEGNAPQIRIHGQSSDHPRENTLMHLSLPAASVSGGVDIYGRPFSVQHLVLDKSASTTNRAWHHMELIWDETQGVRLIIDGAEIASNWGTGGFHMGYASLGKLALWNAQFDELHIFDRPLSTGELNALRKDGILPKGGNVNPSSLGTHRMKHLGWDEQACFIPINGPTMIRQLEPTDARELKNYGWRAVDGVEDSGWPREYKAYEYLNGGGLNIHFAGPETFNYVRKAGNMDEARLVAGGAWQSPSNAVEILRLTGSNFVSTWPVKVTDPLADVSVYLEQRASRYFGKQLRDIAFLQQKPLAREPQTMVFKTYFQPEPPADMAGDNLVRMIAWYRPEERRIISGNLQPEKKGMAAKLFDKLTSPVVNIAAWQTVHLMTPAPSNDLPLNAVRLQLKVEDWQAGTKVNIRLHDPNNLWRALMDVDVELRQKEQLDTCLEFAPTILPAGTELWLTLISSQSGRLICGGKHSSLTMSGPPMAEALAAYYAWQVRILQDYFQSISEPRPWYINNLTNDIALRVASPQYDAIARIVGDLNRRFPEDRLTRGFMIYTHPKDSGYWTNLPVAFPADKEAPRWAVLQKSIFSMFLQFVNWWTDERQVPCGECGDYGDDTDLMQDWPAIACVYDPEHKYRKAVRKLADYCWENHMRNGLNTSMTDVLHAYEEGINSQVDAALMDYGNPILIERLQATARRYDGFLVTPANNGQRRLRGLSFNDKEVREQCVKGCESYGSYILHPGIVLMWYNGNPRLTQLMTEFFDGNPELFPTNGYTSPLNKSLPEMLFMQTGDKRFIVDQYGKYHQDVFDPFWVRMRNLNECPPGRLDSLTNYASDHNFYAGFTMAHITDLGYEDNRGLRRYVAWHYTRDKNVLIPALEYVYKATYYTLPLLTEIQQSDDRVAIKKNLTDFMYLGGMPVSRGQLTPFFAVSYENLTPNFAAMVLDDTPELLRWVGYSFEPREQSGLLRVWNLAPGTYTVRQGVDTNGDDRIDGETKVETMKLKRYEAIPITLPSRQLWIVEAECQSKETPLHERCDLAISAEDAVLEAGTLTVVAHNLGCKPTGPFEVKIMDVNGKVLASQKDEIGLESAADLNDRKKSFTFAGDFKPPLKIVVSGPTEEITEGNNAAILLSR
jgi:hypothetical protein